MTETLRVANIRYILDNLDDPAKIRSKTIIYLLKIWTASRATIVNSRFEVPPKLFTINPTSLSEMYRINELTNERINERINYRTVETIRAK